MSNPLLRVEKVGFRQGKNTILQAVDLQMDDSEIVTIVGPNGAGKSTLLALALGLKKPTSGKVYRRPDLRIGYVPQSINRDPTMPIHVADFIRLARKPVDKALATRIFAELRIESLQDALLADISGGELRRVLLARAMLNQPDLLVLDEPTAGIDASGQEQFYHQLNEWRQRQKLSILLVSHDLHWVMSATDRVICLNTHVCCQGQPLQVLEHPHYQALFGPQTAPMPTSELAFYAHQHK